MKNSLKQIIIFFCLCNFRDKTNFLSYCKNRFNKAIYLSHSMLYNESRHNKNSDLTINKNMFVTIK